jgi:hypothetical protein
MNSTSHKKPILTSGVSSKAAAKSSLKPNQAGDLPIIDFEKENRLANIISLFSKLN